VLVVKKENCSAGGRDVVEKREEGGIGRSAKVGIGGEGSEWRVVESLPAVGPFEVADRDARGDTESPGMEDRGLAQERELTENLYRSLLENVVGEIGASHAGDVAPQRPMAVTEELFQRSPVAGLGEQDKKSLVGGRRLLRM